MSEEQKITGNIHPSNKDLEILKQNFPNCFDKNGDFDFEKFKTQLSKNEINFSKESYGIDWLGKSYARLLATDETTTLLKEDEIFNQKEENKNSENLLIKGDNLEVLKHLSNAYYEKIKMIYIDPPYNTGSDGFVYEDDRKFDVPTLMELAGISEERATRILDFTQSKSNSHSAWLTFMYPRLYIAKQLLKEDGAIFVSIDDNEVAQLRLLMDEVFGEENFISNLVWLNKEGGGSSDSKHFRVKREFILCYGKSKDLLEIEGTEITNIDRYKSKDEYVAQRGNYYLQKLGMGSIQYSESLDYGITAPDSTIIFPKDNNSGKKACWRWSRKKFERGLKNGFIEIKKDSKSIWTVYTKQYLKSDNEGNKIQRTQRPYSIINNYSSTQASKYLDKIGLDNYFSYSKPHNLIQYLIERIPTSNEIILDFFAGSGTTGDAVMQLNAEDGGNRKYILVQLPELIDSTSNKTAYDFVKNELKVEIPTIFDITKERLIRASKKIQEDNLALSEAERKDLSNQDLGFKIFETMPIWEGYNFESEELNQQLNLFDESKLTKEDIKALLITWKTYDGISLTETIQERDLNGYTAYYSSEKLYLMDKGFTTENLKVLLEKIDSDKGFNPTTIIAFGYHFESKSLRQISENIKSYANKKSIDIVFITRY
jgi:adenine-specific DNA-methyltransferase